jgi:hypothetical protein
MTFCSDQVERDMVHICVNKRNFYHPSFFMLGKHYKAEKQQSQAGGRSSDSLSWPGPSYRNVIEATSVIQNFLVATFKK